MGLSLADRLTTFWSQLGMSRRDSNTRERMLMIWLSLGWVEGQACCGGRGLVIGCPGCGRRWR